MSGFTTLPHIGTDEAGKGDYFGPLVIAAAYADAVALERLPQVGVKDSKRLTESSLRQKEVLIKQVCPAYEVVLISPAKYNGLVVKMGNLNRLLAWGHARALESLLERPECRECRVAVADQFGDESYLQRALMARGRQVRLVQAVRAESDPAVAAASILARAAFLRGMERLSERVGFALPRGATHVIPAGRRVYAQGGRALLEQVAKIHFRTTGQVTG